MGIDTATDKESELRIGPTSEGMVRIYVLSEDVDLPMDFAPEDALEIAAELTAAAGAARQASKQGAKKARKR
ncbi:MAG: hypothetical protein HKN60_01070 [Rhizobiales bacterium]|nr:hypothetical protein [Hyphomicrobiales bacterium]